ncbi:MAG: DNA-protecting protein DprA [Lachnospiraceae bacterium]|nr:DNA-protecting protein DprA [Lachnospiraceae bacterium]
MEKNRQREMQYAFATMYGLSRRTKQRLLKTFSEEEILSFTEKEMKQILAPKEWSNYERYKPLYNIEEIQKEWQVLKEKGIHFIYHSDLGFPDRLKQTSDCPLALFYKGRLPGKEKTIAIVGSRIPTAYGVEMAAYFAKELAERGVSIISGMAFGIDVAAHKGALGVNGYTYGILGCGPDVVYPKENFFVYEQILKQGGIISEYKPGELPMSYRFPERNRIISGLSDGVLVVEAKAKSGSLITADQALEQGKDVFALPGRTTDLLSEGCNWLIREGARIVTEPSHILEELFQLCENNEKNNKVQNNSLDNREKIVYDCLSLDPKTVEDIINATNFTVSEVISILFRLELNGYVRQVIRNHYIRQLI